MPITALKEIIPAPEDGRGVIDIVCYYGVSSSGAYTPSRWYDCPVSTDEDNRFLWQYEIYYFSDGTTSQTPYRITGVQGLGGIDGNGISSVTAYFCLTGSSSSTGEESWDWVTTPGTTTFSLRYLWCKELVTFTNGTTQWLTPRIVGSYSNAGTTVTTNTIYQLTATLTPPSSSDYTNVSDPTMTADLPYLWKREQKITQADGGQTSTSWGDWMLIGRFGKKGPSLRGPQVWSTLPGGYQFYDFETEGNTVFDVVLHNSTYWYCTKSHTKSSSAEPSASSPYWRQGESVTLIAAYVLLATNAVIDFLDGNEIRVKDTDGNIKAVLCGSDYPLYVGGSTPSAAPFRVYKDGSTYLYKLYAYGATIEGSITATSGKIAGFRISGDALTNENLNNEACIILRKYDGDDVVRRVTVGTDALPSYLGDIQAVGEFVNHASNEVYPNYGIIMSVRNGKENIAIQLNGGCVSGFAMKNTLLSRRATDTGDKYVTLSRADYNVLTIHTSDVIRVTLPSLSEYDDGHVVRIKRGADGGLYIKAGACVVNGTSTTPLIKYGRNENIKPGNWLSVDSPFDAMEFVWFAGLTATVDGTTYLGVWMQYKMPRDW